MLLRAARVAGATFVATCASALLVAVLLAQESMTADQVLTSVAVLVAGAFGAATDGRVGGDLLVISGTASGTARVVPLTLTLVALATVVLVFRRTTRDVGRGRHGLAVAVLASALLAGLVLALAAVSRSGSGSVLVALDWLAPRDADEASGDVGVRRDHAAFGTFAVTLATLTGAALLRRGWWGPTGARWHGWWHAPVRGVVTLVALLPLAGLLGMLLLAGGDEVPTGDPDATTGLGAVLALVANWGYAVVALGAFGPAGRTVDGSASGDLEVEVGTFHERLGHWTQLEPGLWGSVVVTLLVLSLSARAVVLASGPGRVRGDLARWVALLGATLPLLGVAATVTGSGSAVGQVWGSRGRAELTGTLGVSVGPSTLSVLAVAGLVAVVVVVVEERRRLVPGPGPTHTGRTAVTPVTGGGDHGHTRSRLAGDPPDPRGEAGARVGRPLGP